MGEMEDCRLSPPAPGRGPDGVRLVFVVVAIERRKMETGTKREREW